MKKSKPTTHLCLQCLSEIRPVKITPGHFWLELVLLLFMILPGLLYSVWRLSKRHLGCPVCGAANPVPLGSPAAQRLSKAFNQG